MLNIRISSEGVFENTSQMHQVTTGGISTLLRWMGWSRLERSLKTDMRAEERALRYKED